MATQGAVDAALQWYVTSQPGHASNNIVQDCFQTLHLPGRLRTKAGDMIPIFCH